MAGLMANFDEPKVTGDTFTLVDNYIPISNYTVDQLVDLQSITGAVSGIVYAQAYAPDGAAVSPTLSADAKARIKEELRQELLAEMATTQLPLTDDAPKRKILTEDL